MPSRWSRRSGPACDRTGGTLLVPRIRIGRDMGWMLDPVVGSFNHGFGSISPTFQLAVEPAVSHHREDRKAHMETQKLNRICFTTCIVTVVLGTLFAFALIWGGADAWFLIRGELSVGILFLASFLTLSVSKTFDRGKP